MILSGSHTPGADFTVIDLPTTTALRVELPAEHLRPFIANYHVFDSVLTEDTPQVEWIVPEWAAIRLTFSDAPMRMQAGPRLYEALPPTALYGVTSRALRMSRLNGITVGIGITPLGWARLFTASAETFRDRIVDLATVWPAARVAALYEAVAASRKDVDVKAILDAFLTAHLGDPPRDEAQIAAMWTLYRSGTTVDVGDAVAALGLSPQKLRRLSQRHFGFPPKTLLARARFLRAFIPMLDRPEAVDWSQVPEGYYDTSHFQRDGRRFLGTSPRRFAHYDRPYSSAVLRAFRQVILLDRSAR